MGSLFFPLLAALSTGYFLYRFHPWSPRNKVEPTIIKLPLKPPDKCRKCGHTAISRFHTLWWFQKYYMASRKFPEYIRQECFNCGYVVRTAVPEEDQSE